MGFNNTTTPMHLNTCLSCGNLHSVEQKSPKCPEYDNAHILMRFTVKLHLYDL